MVPVHAETNPWILLDAKTGNLIAHNQATRPWHPASIAKLMTAYTVFREIKSGRIDFASPVRVSALALTIPPSKMGFPLGTIINIDNALKMIMVKSANDIAVALAQSTKGSLDAFVEAMNENAARLGMDATNFTNPHGLHSINQVTTAKDMALLALALANEFPQYSNYFKIPAIKFDKKRMRNSNRLLNSYPGTNGMKTGYTCASGLNIVVRAKRSGKELIAVVLGGNSSVQRNVQAAQLLNAGFNDNFSPSQRLHVSQLKTIPNQYQLPANLTPMICKPNWTERQLSKKQRRQARKKHLANLKEQREIYLNVAVNTGPDIDVTTGMAFGPNPFNFKLQNGAAPKPQIATPQWRPDRTSPPYE
ncbi:MAG: D-alanyl-D-alanine carboxypeptidase [Rhizobiaceae bacterium]|nr:D-alanyl-D-alanine carboxypeptidase [Rhizobiaceae bacterium]